MDFKILYALQSIRTPFLDSLWLFITNMAGSMGEFWLIVGALLLIFRKTRKWGFSVLLSYALVFVVGQFVLKDLIARSRPCHLDETIQLLVSRPSSYSCPSTHTAWAFGAAASLFMNNKKAGIGACVVAALIGFSRMYLFVHFPTDVLAGVALGILMGLIAAFAINKAAKAIKSKA